MIAQTLKRAECECVWRFTDPVHDEDLVDVEPLLQQFGCDGHRVEVAETPETSAQTGQVAECSAFVFFYNAFQTCSEEKTENRHSGLDKTGRIKTLGALCVNTLNALCHLYSSGACSSAVFVYA